MSVYVDNAQNPLGRMKMAHMIADTTDELLAMVHAIGVDPKWIQNAGTPEEHFDISLRMRARAVDRGAVEVSSKTIVRKIQAKRGAA